MTGGNTLRVTGTGCVLIGPEGRTPPLPFITVDANEGAALIAQKLAEAYGGDDLPAEDPNAEAEAAELAAREAAEREAAETAAREAAETEAREAAEREAAETAEREAAEAAANANTGGTDTATDANAAAGGEGGTEGETREEMLIAALDLMEAGDLVKTGDRAGKPKVSAMEAATGLTDLTVHEIDAAVAAKEAAEANA